MRSRNYLIKADFLFLARRWERWGACAIVPAAQPRRGRHRQHPSRCDSAGLAPPEPGTEHNGWEAAASCCTTSRGWPRAERRRGNIRVRAGVWCSWVRHGRSLSARRGRQHWARVFSSPLLAAQPPSPSFFSSWYWKSLGTILALLKFRWQSGLKTSLVCLLLQWLLEVFKNLFFFPQRLKKKSVQKRAAPEAEPLLDTAHPAPGC